MANLQARSLRKAMTAQEIKLWSHLRRLRANGFHFRRQAPLGLYILDFVCFSHRLIVEIDGLYHDHEAIQQRDAARDIYFERRGFRTLRFTNREVDFETEGVYQAILQALAENQPP